MNLIWKFPFSNVQLQWLEWIEIQENLTYNRTPVLIPSDIMTTKVSIKDAIITLKLCKDQKAITFWLKFDDEYDNITTSNHTEYSSQCIYIRGFIVIGCESEKFLCSFFKLTKCCASLMTHLLFWKTKRAKTFRIQNWIERMKRQSFKMKSLFLSKKFF